jgi:beta-ribofuranosylaminobenzene 5'-phosphate synthase
VTTIRSGSRLHFGLFDLRRFGSVGMMIEEPAVEATALLDAQWSVGGLSSTRLQFVIDRLTNDFPDLPPMRVEVEKAPPEHAGFGSGTQVSLAVATAIMGEAKMEKSSVELASILGRGNRSTIGLHGFEAGGLLMDSGKSDHDMLSPLAARVELPDHWRVLLITPLAETTWSGHRERNAFEVLAGHETPDQQNILRCIAESNLLPAARAGNLTAFGAALTEFNVLAGHLFAPVQGGCYASTQGAQIVEKLASLDLAGVGQSSWGPTIFAFDVDEEKLRRIGQPFMEDGAVVRVARPLNQGAALLKSRGLQLPQTTRTVS